MEEVAVSGKSAADDGCNYRASSSSDVVDATVSSANHHSSDMIQQHQHLRHPHQFQTGHGRLLPPQYDSLTSLNNNNSYSADSVSNDSKYYQLTAHLLGQGYPYHHNYHNHHRYQTDNIQQQYQLDYCNAVPGGSYSMTSSSSVSAISGGSGLVSRAGYCGRGGQFDVSTAAAAAYSAGETRSQAGYWTTSCVVGTDQQQQPADLDDQADVKPTLVDASSYLVPGAQYPGRHQSYLHAWYQPHAGYSWGVPGSGGVDTGGGYYTGSSGYNDVITQSTSPPMHHILRGVYNTLQVRALPRYCYSCLGGAVVERWTRDRKLAGSTPGRGAIKSTRSTQTSIPPG